MDERRLTDALRGLKVPDAEPARRRTWQLSADAFAARKPRSRRGRGPAALLAAAALFAGGVALTPAGSAVADLAREAIERELAAPPRPDPYPGVSRPERPPGWLLAVDDDGVLRVVGGNAVGAWDGGAWSPRHRYVAAWRGRTLAAVARRSHRTAWQLRAPAAVAGASWSPEGFHVAYLAGTQVRVVAGNGQRDRLLDRHAARVVPAFRPNDRRTLAWVRADGRIELRDVFTGAVVAVSPKGAGRGAREIAWTRQGGTLAIRTATAVRLWTVGRGVRTTRFGTPTRAIAGGTTIVVLLRDDRRATSEVVALRPQRSLLRVRGRIDDLAFVPDGRRVAALWPGGRQWLLLDAAK